MKAFVRQPPFKIVFVALTFILSLILLFYFVQREIHTTIQNWGAKKQISSIETQNGGQGLPVRLIIPKIGVDAAIEPVGLTSKGAMGAPSNATNVGWFDLGPHPGDGGSAVIAGHFDGVGGGPGVFTDLYKLKEGDKVYIEDDKGTSATFVVRESRTYDPGYADEVFAQSDSAHLNLITCDGVWDGVKKSYNKRLVVFTDIAH